jgi:hypothetical protein
VSKDYERPFLQLTEHIKEADADLSRIENELFCTKGALFLVSEAFEKAMQDPEFIRGVVFEPATKPAAEPAPLAKYRRGAVLVKGSTIGRVTDQHWDSDRKCWRYQVSIPQTPVHEGKAHEPEWSENSVKSVAEWVKSLHETAPEASNEQ